MKVCHKDSAPKDHQGAESLFKFKLVLPTNPDTAGRWSPEPSFRQAFIEARRGYLAWYKSDWGTIMAFNIICWCWEPSYKLGFLLSSCLVALRK